MDVQVVQLQGGKVQINLPLKVQTERGEFTAVLELDQERLRKALERAAGVPYQAVNAWKGAAVLRALFTGGPSAPSPKA